VGTGARDETSHGICVRGEQDTTKRLLNWFSLSNEAELVDHCWISFGRRCQLKTSHLKRRQEIGDEESEDPRPACHLGLQALEGRWHGREEGRAAGRQAFGSGAEKEPLAQ